jgi:hypothetical protein
VIGWVRSRTRNRSCLRKEKEVQCKREMWGQVWPYTNPGSFGHSSVLHQWMDHSKYIGATFRNLNYYQGPPLSSGNPSNPLSVPWSSVVS